MAMLLSFSVHQNLLNDWQTQLPKTTPNHFVLNLFEHQRDDFQTDLTTHNISSQTLFPIVRGRLIKINNQAVQKIVSKDSQGERAIHRDLSLTWSEQLPDGNLITSGNWHKNTHPYKVSIEQKLATSLNIQLRDELTFTIGHENINATVTSIRQVNWDSMKPNFYFIFSPDSLTPFPKTFITSFYLAPENKNTLNTLAKKYPAITILEVDFILNQLSLILKQLTQAINYLLVFALIAGLIVLAATINATLDERRHQSALLRTLGASRSLLRNNHLFEFAGLGVFASLFAVLLHDLASFALYHFILKITYVPSLTLWVFVPLIGTTIITLTGLWSIRKVVNKSPLSILREH
jgi:putative ABC transport system permease protein